jgi:DDE superfamily endonuclease
MMVPDENGVLLHSLIESLPRGFMVIADAAYKPTEHCVPLYYGASRREADKDNFNYFASQCRIRIEMSFGMMTQKFRILCEPLPHKDLMKVKFICLSIARLHNFIIDQHIQSAASKESEWNPDAYCSMLGLQHRAIADENERSDGFIDPADVEADAATQSTVPGYSMIRHMMMEHVAERQCVWPVDSVLHPDYVG